MGTGSKEGQDIFVSRLLKSRYFVDLGCSQGRSSNNSILLEQMGWQGLLFDRNASAIDNCRRTRRSACYEVDATTYDFRKCFRDNAIPSVIDYISFDVDASTPAALANFPFEDYSFLVMTIEHDSYQAGTLIKKAIWRRLCQWPKYRALVSNVQHSPDAPFEDWIINTEYFPQQLMDEEEASDIVWSDYLSSLPLLPPHLRAALSNEYVPNGGAPDLRAKKTVLQEKVDGNTITIPRHVLQFSAVSNEFAPQELSSKIPSLRNISQKCIEDHAIYCSLASVIKPLSILECGGKFNDTLLSLALGARLYQGIYGAYSQENNPSEVSAKLDQIVGDKLNANVICRDFNSIDPQVEFGRRHFGLLHLDASNSQKRPATLLNELRLAARLSERILVADAFSNTVIRGINAFVATRNRPVSLTYYQTQSGLALLQL